MSALDFVAGNTTRYYTFTNPSLGSGTWTIGTWFRASNLTSTDNQYLWGIGTSGAAGSAYIYVAQAGGAVRWGSNIKNDSSVDWLNAGQGTALTQDGKDYLIVVQRHSDDKIQVYFVEEGTSAGSPYSPASTVSGSLTTTSMQIGSIASIPSTARMLESPSGEFFICVGTSLSSSEVTTLAAGNTIWAVRTPNVHLPFRNGAVSSEPNLGTAGGSASIVGTGYSTTTDFFPVGGHHLKLNLMGVG